MVVGFDLTWMNVENRSGGIFQYALRLISALAEFTEIDIVALIGPTGVGLFDHLKDPKHFRVILLDDSETLRAVIQSEAVDVVHTPLQFHLNLTLSVPMITTLHDLQHLHYPEFFTQEELDFRDTHYRKSAEFSERLIVSFEHVKEDITKSYNIPSEKIDVCPIGMPVLKQVNQRRFDEVRGKYRLAKRYLLYPANTWRHKNHTGLLRALKLVHDKYEMKIPLVCTGHKEDYYSEIKTVREELQLEQFVHFTGYIPEEDMALILENATLVVIPTLYEAGSFPLMEAMVYEVPVICSRVTSLPDTLGNSKYLFDPNNIAEMAEKIAEMLQNDKLMEENRANSRKRKMENSWEKAVRHFVNTYEKAVKSFDQKRKISFYDNWRQNYEMLTSRKVDGLKRRHKQSEADRAARLEVIGKYDLKLRETIQRLNLSHSVLPKISIITPSFNQAVFIERTIRSVIDQGYPNLEYIIIDGGSTDGTLEIIKRFEPHLSYWVSEPDSGQAEAINKGFSKATGDLVSWLNSDDTYTQGALWEWVKVVSQYPKTDIWMANVHNYIDENDHVFSVVENTYVSHAESVKYWKTGGIRVTQPSVFFRRKLLEDVKTIDPQLHYGLDYDFFLRLSRDHGIVIVSGKWANYRLHRQAKSGTSAGDGFYKFIPEWHLVSKRHWGRPWNLRWWNFLMSFQFHRPFFRLGQVTSDFISTRQMAARWFILWPRFLWHLFRGRGPLPRW